MNPTSPTGQTMPCDDCLSRRAFLARSTLAVAGAAALVTGCGDGRFGPSAASSSVSSITIKVSDFADLGTVGTLVSIPPANSFIAVKRTGAATFLALSVICTHQGCATNISGNTLICPCHDSRFDSDGHVTQQPQGTGGSATNLFVYATSYNAATDILTIG